MKIMSYSKFRKLLEYEESCIYFDLHIYTPTFVETHRAITLWDMWLTYKLACIAYNRVIVTVGIEHNSDVYIYCE